MSIKNGFVVVSLLGERERESICVCVLGFSREQNTTDFRDVGQCELPDGILNRWCDQANRTIWRTSRAAGQQVFSRKERGFVLRQPPERDNMCLWWPTGRDLLEFYDYHGPQFSSLQVLDKPIGNVSSRARATTVVAVHARPWLPN